PLAVRAPLTLALAPEIDLDVVERRGHVTLADDARAQPARDPLRGDVLRIDAVDDVGPAEMVEGPVHGRGGGLGGVALAVGLGHDAPADLIARPAVRPPGSDPADPAPARLLDHREHGEAFQRPGAGPG